MQSEQTRAAAFPVATLSYLWGATLLWAAALIPIALFLPLETVNSGLPGVQPRFSVYEVNGAAALGVAFVPLACTVLTFALRVPARRSATAHALTWLVADALLVAALVGTVTYLVGIWAVPSGVLLCLVSAAITRPRVTAHSGR